MPEANDQPRLTRTERALLEEAARRPHGTLRAWLWYGMTSRPGPGGKRAVSALQGLVRKGLADGLRAESTSGPDGDGAGCTRTTEFTARLTAAGREALRVAAEAEARSRSSATR